jgi:phosphoadenosine phosphosulfate reductase
MEASEATRQLEGRSAEEVLNWTQAQFGPRSVFASSFGAEDMVILDMIAKGTTDPARRIRVVTLDTGRLFQETYDVMQEARDKYGIPIEIVFPDRQEVEEMVARGGPNLFYESVENRKACCGVRKVHPLNRALKGADAWVVGLRRDQSTERSDVTRIAKDEAHNGIWKISPLAEWSWDEVMAYVKTNHVPINRLHAKGFPSIGCAPCTRAVPPGADPRSGRWWWELGAKECGLHVHDTTTDVAHPLPASR